MNRMSNTNGIEYHYFPCECGNEEHAVLMTYDPDIFGEENPEERFPELVINVQLAPYLGFWKRLVAAFKYVFNIKDDRCHWDVCMIRESDLDCMEDLIKRYRADLKNSKINRVSV